MVSRKLVSEQKELAKKFLMAPILSGLFVISSGCSMKASLQDLSSAADFGKTTIQTFAAQAGSTSLAVGDYHGIADNQDEMWVRIRLMNNDNTTVSAFRPEFEIEAVNNSDPARVSVHQTCDESDADGVSWCALKASRAGTYNFIVKNLPVVKTKSIVFDPRRIGGTITGLVVGSAQNVTATGGYKVSVAVGTETDQIVATDVGGQGYKIYLSTQGAIVSGQ